MALWQFDLLIVPRRQLLGVDQSARQRVSAADLDCVDWWAAGYRLDADSAQLIRGFAAPRESWDPETQSWGEEDGDRIDITLEEERVVEIIARIDARHIQEEFVKGVVALAVHLECVFVTSDLRVIPPLMREVWGALESSAARRFVRDPTMFLEAGDVDSPEW